MMPSTFEENLARARHLCEQIKQKTVCSNDIIPRTELPFFPEEITLEVRLRFGQKRYELHETYTGYLAILRTLLHAKAKHEGMAAPNMSALLAITRLGVGECSELAYLAFYELIKNNHKDAVLIIIEGQPNLHPIHPAPHRHCLVLLGGCADTLTAGADFTCFNHLKDNIVVLDPYLNHVGRANQYLATQAAYLQPYAYHRIMKAERVTNIHCQNIKYLDTNLINLVNYAHEVGINVFDRSAFMRLPKRGAVATTALLEALNQHSVLKFNGMHEDYKVTAIAEVKTEEERTLAESLQNKLQAGVFKSYARQRFFVLREINVQEEHHLGQSLPERIWSLT